MKILSQIPGIKIDTISTVEKDNLEFLKFKMKIVYPNKMVLMRMYGPFLEKRIFCK